MLTGFAIKPQLPATSAASMNSGATTDMERGIIARIKQMTGAAATHPLRPKGCAALLCKLAAPLFDVTAGWLPANHAAAWRVRTARRN